MMPGWFHFGGDRDMEMWAPTGTSRRRCWARRGSHFMLNCLRAAETGRYGGAGRSAELRAIQTRINRGDIRKDTDPRMSARVDALQRRAGGQDAIRAVLDP